MKNLNKKISLILFLIFIFTISIFFFFKNKEIKLNKENFFEIEKGLVGRNMNSLYDLDDLILEMSKTKYVLLGESTHGSKEYYLIRKHLSKNLIKNFDFNFIAVEGDWASIYELNKYIKYFENSEKSASEAMAHLDRWPTWMWNNEVILDLIEWLREYNKNLSPEKRIGFYGIDVYSPMDSYQKLKKFLDENQLALEEIKQLQKCFDQFNNDFNNYPEFIKQTNKNCQSETEQLFLTINDLELNKKEIFVMKQKMDVLKNAEKHFRYMLSSGYESWNARASHFASTVENIANYYGLNSKGIVWAHNTHVGDSSFVVGAENMLNIGKILRKNQDVFILGFVKNTGKVNAGNYWGGEMQTINIPVAKSGSYGELLANNNLKKALFIFDKNEEFIKVKNQRAIGVVYNPWQEFNNYVPTIINKRYDAIIFLNETNELKTCC